MINDLRGAWGLVTGASSGIGADFARVFAKNGLNLILVARRQNKLELLKSELQKEYNIEVEVIVSDLSLVNSAQEVFNQATNNRSVQVLINNAGRGQYGPTLSNSLQDHTNTINLNITSLTQLTYLFLEHMSKHNLESYISNIASIASYVTLPYFGIYTGSKRYVKDFTLALYDEYKKSNIHFCCISPGGTYTEFMDHAGQELTKQGHASMMSSQKVVEIGIKAMNFKKALVVTGILNKLVTLLPRFFPERLFFVIAGKVMQSSVNIKRL